jgi:acyl-CoA synthetase (AMP-forming)/AMP-acid ligase II
MTHPLFARISDYARWHAERTPDAPAMKLGDRETSYAGLAEAVDRLARALLAAGVKKGDRVATLQTPHPDYFVAFLATASIGAIWMGLNPRYRLEELSYAVSDAEPVLLLARSQIEARSYAEEIEKLRASPSLRQVVIFEGDPPARNTHTMADFLAAGASISDEELLAARMGCGGRDPCLIVYTSGSTGKPKGALLHHEGIIRFSREQNRLWPVEPFRVVNYFPINHIGCVVDCSTPCYVAGGELCFMEHFDPRECLALMMRERITLWGSVPSVFQMQLALPDFDSFDLGAVQLIVWGGAAMPGDTIRRLVQISPRLATNYGMTETTSAITAVSPNDDLDVLENSVGEAFPGVEVRLLDPETGAIAEDGRAGEVQARSALNFLGYWNRPEATAEAFTSDSFFRTGDLAMRRPDGRYRIVGRLKEMYKSGGYNVYPRETEAVLEDHPAVAEAAVVSISDPTWQEVGVAYVVPRAAISVAELEAHCRNRLANYKIPKRFILIETMPLLPIGKTDKRALKERASREVV